MTDRTTPTKSSGKRMHVVPRFILAGFAMPRTSKGRLWSFELETGTYRPATPKNLAVKKHFYRLDSGDHNRYMLDDALTKHEDIVAPILKSVEDENRFPSEAELGEILWFTAILSTRGEAYRSGYVELTEQMANFTLDYILSSREQWEHRLSQQGIVPSAATDYDRARRMRDDGRLNMRVRRDAAVLAMAKGADRAFEQMKALRWSVLIPDASLGSFVCCDTPVRRAKQWSVAFSSRLALAGQPEGGEGRVIMNRGLIAEMNSSTILNAQRFVYTGERKILCNEQRLRPFIEHLPEREHATQDDPD